MSPIARLSFSTATAFLSSPFSGSGCKGKISPRVIQLMICNLQYN